MSFEEWASGSRPAIRDMIGGLGGDLGAFDADPLSAVDVLDGFIARVPWAQFETDDWAWLHAQLVAYVAEALIHHHGGGWKAVPDASAPDGWRPVIEIPGAGGTVREVDVARLVHQELHPVPQRVPRLVERAVALAEATS
ncbi:hypothetical protein ACFV98_35230 [Streptomyces violascens]|uniref:hypothetical protein n=1 Tax=Streptomyces violascens TaxID=67381 RepID=UPI003665B2BC